MLRKLRSDNAPRQIQSIEMLRGLASLMVCYFHLARGNPRFLADSSVIKQSAYFGWSGVEVFFVISGFVIPFSMYQKKYTLSNFFVFFKKRIIRIEPPYLISVIMVVALNFASAQSPSFRGAPFHLDWANILGHVAYLNIFTGSKWVNDVYWSLAIEFQYYLFIALTFTCIVSEKLYVRILFILGFAALSLLPVPDGRFLFSYPGYFIAGILLFQLMCNRIGRIEFFISVTFILALLFFQSGGFLSLLVLATLLTIFFIKKVPAYIKWPGVISYSLYLIHIPIGGRIINFTETHTANSFVRECMVFVALFFCLIAAAVFYKLFEQKFKAISASIKYGHEKMLVTEVTV